MMKKTNLDCRMWELENFQDSVNQENKVWLFLRHQRNIDIDLQIRRIPKNKKIKRFFN